MTNKDENLIIKLKTDIRRIAAQNMTQKEARYLVDTYYQVQEFRKATANQVKSLCKNDEPNALLTILEDNFLILEREIKKALGDYAQNSPVGRWAMSIIGIGPVIAAGLLAHIDIEKAPTAGHIFSFAGLNPNTKWEKGQKRPWNAGLKVLCWKIGQSFVKVHNNPNDIYGKIYKERKDLEIAKNEEKAYVEQAVEKLKKFKIGKDTTAYEYYSKGQLPPGHIDQRAQRYATKLFLAHWHEVAYREKYGKEPPLPYPIAFLDHAHKINVPQ